MDDFQFYEDWWNVESEDAYRQPTCVGCVKDCRECVLRTLAWAGHREGTIIPEKDNSCDNEEVFDC